MSDEIERLKRECEIRRLDHLEACKRVDKVERQLATVTAERDEARKGLDVANIREAERAKRYESDREGWRLTAAGFRAERDAALARVTELAAQKYTAQAEAKRLRKLVWRFADFVEHNWRSCFDGNAPGHAHSVPCIWDASNGPPNGGKPCRWCRFWFDEVIPVVAVAGNTPAAAPDGLNIPAELLTPLPKLGIEPTTPPPAKEGEPAIKTLDLNMWSDLGWRKVMLDSIRAAGKREGMEAAAKIAEGVPLPPGTREYVRQFELKGRIATAIRKAARDE